LAGVSLKVIDHRHRLSLALLSHQVQLKLRSFGPRIMNFQDVFSVRSEIQLMCTRFEINFNLLERASREHLIEKAKKIHKLQ
jgi:hypothetical protein